MAQIRMHVRLTHLPFTVEQPCNRQQVGREAVVRTLLGAGADPNAQCGHYGGVSATMIEEEPVFEGSLQAKAGAGNVDIVRLLIDAGANVNARGVGGGIAFAAARNRGYEAIELILLGARTRLRAPIVKYLPV